MPFQKFRSFLILMCLIFNIVARAIHYMPIHEIRNAVSVGVDVVIDGYMEKIKKDGHFNFENDYDDSKDKIIN